MTRVLLAATLALAGFGAATFAQPTQLPNLSGTWRLSEERSRIDIEVAFVGLVGAGAPRTLHITQPANGTLVVESQVNESHARLYVPGSETETAVYLGEAGSVKVTARWHATSLVAEGIRTMGTGPSATVQELRESIGLSSDGQTLEVELALSGSPAAISALRYERIDDVGPCESWPSPCKEPPR